MNYRHAFHAGNFADLIKHAALTLCLDAMARGPERLTVIDTHAGAGVYDLEGEAARKSGEAALGIARLMADPAAPEAFDMLTAAVTRLNGGGAVTAYPGSPALICAGLRDADRLIACELRPEEHRLLADFLAPMAEQASAQEADGFKTAIAQTPARTPVLVVIDPPFERGDDYARIVETCGGVLARNPSAVMLIWMPLKDLETFDGFLRRLEAIDPPATLVAEVRLRPLTDPMKMNGCALVLINPPAGMEPRLEEACRWIAEHIGEDGAQGSVWRL